MNDFPLFSFGEIVEVRAKPKSSKSILEYESDLKIVVAYLKSIPEDNKANDELVKLFKKQLKLRVELVSGFKGKDKKVKVL